MSAETVSSFAIVIGASAGAVEALASILPELPKDFPAPVIIVVHVPPDSNSALPELFRPRCRVNIKEAEDKEFLQPATVYFAPPNYHLLVESDRSLSLSSDEPELYSRPSINALFESAADVFGDKLVAVILTGANSDGANGLRAACEVGAVALVQNPDTAEAKAMPSAALKACPDAQVLSVSEIGGYLQQLTINGNSDRN